MNPDDLIQLMRLSGTSKVRERIHAVHQSSQEGNLLATQCYAFMVELFTHCKRADDTEAWPPEPQ